jgi:DNA mismatch repair protein MutS
MNFISDKQTTDELNLLGKYQQHSVYNMFNKVWTKGGQELLEAMLRHPLTDAARINERSALFRNFQRKAYIFPLSGETVDQFVSWLESDGSRTSAGSLVSTYTKKMLSEITRDERYSQLEKGVHAAAEVLKTCHSFITANVFFDGYDGQVKEIKEILADKGLAKLRQIRQAEKLSPKDIAYYDHLLKLRMATQIENVLNFIYELDVYIAVSAVAKSNGFGYALANSGSNELRMKDLKHPALNKATGNDLHLSGECNLLFLTGANMAGKSTLMKSIGIALYLAHAGFPVAAQEMTFSVKQGLYSSINVPDNISLGYSHFYAEVLRVKQAAEMVSDGKNMLVMFDELFKGTNVKDAYDGTLEVTKAFSKHRNCLFIISTHIIEVGETLTDFPNIQFGYMPTVMDGNHPRYTYQLMEGITEDRQGMLIIENEGILEFLK